MTVENDINKLNNFLENKTIDYIERKIDGIMIYFKDGSRFMVKSYQYQTLIS
jgi:hypothetical protein